MSTYAICNKCKLGIFKHERILTVGLDPRLDGMITANSQDVIERRGLHAVKVYEKQGIPIITNPINGIVSATFLDLADHRLVNRDVPLDSLIID